MSGHVRRCGRSCALIALVLGMLLGSLAAPAAHAGVTVGDVQVTETNGNATATFRVTRSAGILTGPATIHFSTVDGTAHAPGDYAAVSGDLQFGSLPLGGTQIQEVPVTVVGDRLDEPAETFRLVLSGPDIDDASAIATIDDDDPPPPLPPPPPAPPPPSPPPPPPPPPAAPAAQAAPAGDQAAPATPDDAAAPGADEPSSSGSPQLGLTSPRLRRPSIMLVTVACPRQTSRCAGKVTIFSRPNPRSKVKALRRERRLGQRNFTLAPGASRTLTIALSRSDRVLLNRAGRMLVRAYAVTTDGSGRSGVRRTTGTLIARTTHS